jgi:hypothetical protein
MDDHTRHQHPARDGHSVFQTTEHQSKQILETTPTTRIEQCSASEVPLGEKKLYVLSNLHHCGRHLFVKAYRKQAHLRDPSDGCGRLGKVQVHSIWD